MPVTGRPQNYLAPSAVAASASNNGLGDESTCLELALEGERLCKGGECRLGVQFLEAAVQVGTDDLKILSAVYSQLGNAHFYLQDYSKALDYHTLDLSLARTMNDKAGEAKASGNLGNTLKVLGKFEEAAICCVRHLELSRELGDRMGEARALYNLGNVHHAHGKHAGRSSVPGAASGADDEAGDGDTSLASPVRSALRRAADYYAQNLVIVRELVDRAGVGRACGNLGNTHYLLGNFHEAIRYHTERLAIAKEFGDRGAERRAHSNLGNAHILLGELDTAADHYRRCLALAKQLGEPALEAQACYSLGNTCTLMRDYRQAIDYHARHLRIAEQLGDRVGEARACWSLGNAHAAVGENAKALDYAARHLTLSEQLGDDIGASAARLNLADLRQLLGLAPLDGETSSAAAEDHEARSDGRGAAATASSIGAATGGSGRAVDNDDDGLMVGAGDFGDDNHGRRPLLRVGSETSGLDAAAAAVAAEPYDNQDLFLDMISRCQGRRMDEQRCSAPTLAAASAAAAATAAVQRRQQQQQQQQQQMEDAFLDMLAGVQGSRMNDQRASLPNFPGLRPAPPDVAAAAAAVAAGRGGDKENVLPDDAFFDMLMRCQATRLDEQRTALPQASANAAPTVPDDDVFGQIARQSQQQQPQQERPGSRLFSKFSLKKRKR